MIKRITSLFGQASDRLIEWRDNVIARRSEDKSSGENGKTPPPIPENGKDNNAVTIEISLWSAFKVTLVVMLVILLSNVFVQLIDILVTFLVALFLAAAFSPAVDRIQKWGVPRAFSIIIMFTLVFGFISFLIGTLIPIIANQLFEIADSIQQWFRATLNATQEEETLFQKTIGGAINTLLLQFNSEQLLQALNDNIESIATGLTDIAGRGSQIILSTVSTVFNMVLVLLLTFFLILDRKATNVFFHSLFPAKHQKYLTEKMSMVQKKIGEWVHGQIFLFLIVSIFTWIVFTILGIPYALTLAMLFGIAEFVPYVGPVSAFLISAPIAFNESLFLGFALIIFYVIYQFLEGNFLVPIVMRQAVGLPPIVTILALIVGASFPNLINPIVGMILAVPVATIIAIFINDFAEKNSKSFKSKTFKSFRLKK